MLGPLSRRTLFKGALAGAGAATLAACSSPVGAGIAGTQLAPGTIDYWNLFGGGDGVRMEQMEDGFRKVVPDWTPYAADLEPMAMSVDRIRLIKQLQDEKTVRFVGQKSAE